MIKEILTEEEYNHANESDYSIVECPFCSRTYAIDWTEKEIEMMLKWSTKRFSREAILIQEALPNRSIYEREIMRYSWNGEEGLKCCDECSYPLRK